jgi:hypothetical protein
VSATLDARDDSGARLSVAEGDAQVHVRLQKGEGARGAGQAVRSNPLPTNDA